MIIKNARLDYRMSDGYAYYQVIGDTERFGEQEILFESPFFDEVKDFVAANDCKRRKTRVKFGTDLAGAGHIECLDKMYGTNAYGNTGDGGYRLIAYISCGSEDDMHTLLTAVSRTSGIGFSTDTSCASDRPDENNRWVFWAAAYDVKGHVNGLKKGLRDFII